MRSEALLSAQLIKRKQKYSESVDEYAHESESLFEKSYGKRAGMDQASKELLKRDLFVQGPAYCYLPSASSFGDALHQAGLAEEQPKQLNELHSRHSTDQVQPQKPSGKEKSNKDGDLETTRLVPPKDTWCYTNKTRDCHQRQHSLGWKGQEPPQVQSSPRRQWKINVRDCKRSGPLWSTRRWQVSSYAGVDRVTGAVGPLFYVVVTIEKLPVEAMLDPGSSTMIIYFEQFKKIGQQAHI